MQVWGEHCRGSFSTALLLLTGTRCSELKAALKQLKPPWAWSFLHFSDSTFPFLLLPLPEPPCPGGAQDEAHPLTPGAPVREGPCSWQGDMKTLGSGAAVGPKVPWSLPGAGLMPFPQKLCSTELLKNNSKEPRGILCLPKSCRSSSGSPPEHRGSEG